jgi:hypothetical protein
MANSLSEGFVRITYTGTAAPHHQIVPINFDGTPTAGSEPSFTTKGAGTKLASVGIGEYLDAYLSYFNDDSQFALCEVYAVDPDTEERTFIWGMDLATSGTSPNSRVPLEMMTLSFKTVGGGSLRIVGMETIVGVNTVLQTPFPDDSPADIVSTYIVSADSIVIGRDNTYAFAPLRQKSKTSDVLRERAGL